MMILPKSLALFSYFLNEASLHVFDTTSKDIRSSARILLFPRGYVGRVQLTRNAYIVDGISRSLESLWSSEDILTLFDESDISGCKSMTDLGNIYSVGTDVIYYTRHAKLIDSDIDEHEVSMMLLDKLTCFTISPHDGSINYYSHKGFKMTGIVINDGSVGVVTMTVDHDICVLLMEDNSLTLIDSSTRIKNYSIQASTVDLGLGIIDAIKVNGLVINIVIENSFVMIHFTDLVEFVHDPSHVEVNVSRFTKHSTTMIDSNLYSWRPNVRSIKSTGTLDN